MGDNIMLNKIKELKKSFTIGYRVFKNPVFKSELKLAFSDINRANKERRQALKDLKEAMKKEEQSIEILHTEKVRKAVIRFISLTGGVIKQEELTMALESDKTSLETVFD
jgi:hypothetical protein